MMTSLNPPSPRARRNRGIGSRLFFGFVLLALVVPTVSSAMDPAEVSAQKSYWQNRYRGLLEEADRLRATVAAERELYADANRRNYRRGSKRHVHRDAAEEASAELERVSAELATIVDDGRRAGALPGWFYEVEAEFEDARQGLEEAESPAAAAEGGRNPLYRGDSKKK